ncbi:MAG: hypothetical protein ACFCU5_16145 [Pleurocapsa sp.]
MTLTALLTTEDFNDNVKIELGINYGLSEDSLDNYQINLTFGDDNSLTTTVGDINLNENQTSPILFTSLDPDELLSPNQEDYLQVVINLDNDNLTGKSQQQIVLTVFDSQQLSGRQFIDPLSGAVINSTNSELVVAIDTSNSNINEESSLLFEEASFTLALDRNISGVVVSDLLVEEDSLLSFGSISYHYSDSSTDITSSNDSELVTVTQVNSDSMIING